MTKLSKNGLRLLATSLALATLAVPSALAWGPVGTTHVLDSPNLSMTVVALGTGWTCSSTWLHIDVASPASSTAMATTGLPSGCGGTGGATGCTVDATVMRLPWALTGLPSEVILHGAEIAFAFTGACPFSGAVVTVTGSLTGGAWSAGAHSVTYASDSGFTATSAGSPLGGVSTSGTFTDTSGTLTL